MTRRYKQLLTLVMFFVLGTVASVTFADEYQHIDNLALRIQQQTRQLKQESFRFRHTPQYRHLVIDLAEMEQRARHIHDVAHHSTDLHHLERDLSKLDSLLHHVQELFQQIEQSAHFGHGHIHGGTHNVHRLLHSIEDSVHHIQADVDRLSRVRHRHYGHGAYRHYNSHQGRSIGLGGFSLNRNGIVIQNGRLGFNFGF